MNASVYSTKGRVALDEKRIIVSGYEPHSLHREPYGSLICDLSGPRAKSSVLLIYTGGTIGIYAILE